MVKEEKEESKDDADDNDIIMILINNITGKVRCMEGRNKNLVSKYRNRRGGAKQDR